ncbi:MAG: ATP-binding protein [Maribacter arcticus]|uniref:sensor histidine kinase n=1 Tax=Maribacter arcticus TaxID=561365 RepID=UPI003001299A
MKSEAQLKAEIERLQRSVEEQALEVDSKNRELEIEAALERVRERAMSMQKSEELRELVFEFYKQIHPFGFAKWGFEIKIAQEDKSGFYCWISPPGARIQPEGFEIPTLDHWVLKKYWSTFELQTPSVTIEVSGDDKRKLGVLLLGQSDMKNLPEDVKTNIMETEYVHFSVAAMRFGLLKAVDMEPVLEKDSFILQRFAKVFEQTYTRFLDLQKAEAQAREAQIETALERIRARALAMHTSEELIEVANVLREQMGMLGQPELEASVIELYEVDNQLIESWYAFRPVSNLAGNIISGTSYFPKGSCFLLSEMLEMYHSSLNEYTLTASGEKLEEWISVLIQESPEIVQYMNQEDSTPETMYYHFSDFSGGSLCMTSGIEPSEEAKNLQRRAASVFDLAYRRFLDLQKAEAQAREAQIEAALERVRSSMMAMHKSDELRKVVASVFTQLQMLDFDSEACAVIIYNSDHTAEHWLTGFTHDTYPRSYKIPYVDNPYCTDFIDAWKKGVPFQEFYMEGKPKVDYANWMLENSEFKYLPDEFKKEMVNPERLNFSDAFMRYGMIEVMGGTPLPVEKISVLKRFANVFEQTYTRFLDLQKAEAQAREAQVEVALERIRSRSMAMRSSEELREVVQEMYNQVEKLGISNWGCFLLIFDKEKQHVQGWFSEIVNSKYADPFYFDNKDHEVIRKSWKFWESDEEFMSIHQKDEVKYEFVTYLFTKTGMKDLPEEVKTMIINEPQVYFQYVNMEHGLIQYIDIKPFPVNSITVLKRITDVFEQAYTRFLDLEKAEAQAREAEIQLALERVRARTMAMQKSDELSEAGNVLFQQLHAIGIVAEGSWITLINPEEDSMTMWVTHDNIARTPKKVFGKDHPNFRAEIDAWKSKQESIKIQMPYDDFVRSSKEIFGIEVISAPEKPIVYIQHILHGFGYLGGSTFEEISEKDIAIYKRFTKVFEQTYTRFLDLQKAETQAREAQIETALEKVRSRTMAMQKSQELAEVSLTLFEQVEQLGIKTWSTGFNVWSEDDTSYIDWVVNSASGKFIEPYKVDLTAHPSFLEISRAKKRGDDFFVHETEGETLKEVYRLLFQMAKTQFEDIVKAGFQLPAHQINHYVFGSKVSLMFITFEPCLEAHDIFKRFGKVFEQTYTRFLDLQKAEAQAREAEIQLALERVRARTMAMQKSEELSEAGSVLFQQLHAIGIVAEGSWITLIDPEEDSMTMWVTHHNISKIPKKVFGDDHPNFRAEIDAWKSKQESIKIQMPYDDFVKSSKEIFGIEVVNAPQKPIVYIQHILHGFGFLGASTYEEISEKDLAIYRRFTKVFEQTYTRFLDLKKAEAQAREAQIEAALERVRSRAMAMRKSEELAEAAELLYGQLGELGITSWTCGYVFIDEENNQAKVWMIEPNGQFFWGLWTVPLYEEKVLKERHESWRRKEKMHRSVLKGKDNIAHHQYIVGHSPVTADAAEDFFSRIPVDLVFTSLHFSYGYLMVITEHLLKEEDDNVLLRFAEVFQLTYTRFLDLQKAEAQAREAQIEASLERVRSKTMAMHNSQDVGESVATLFDELFVLGLLGVNDRCGIGIMQPNEIMEAWTAAKTPEGKAELTIGFINMKVHPMMVSAYGGWVEKKEINQYILEGEDKLSYYDAIRNQSDYKIKRDYFSDQIRIVHTDFYFNEGCLYVFSENEFSAEATSVFLRFVGVFGQTYRRYLDLQRAEKQAKEAQIEAALERVRSRSMAMQHSSELNLILSKVFEELTNLELQMERAVIWIYYPENRSVRWWAANPEAESGSESFFIANQDDPVYDEYWKAWEERRTKDLYVLEGDYKENWTEILFNKTECGRLPEVVKAAMVKPERVYLYNTFNDFGVLFISCLEPLSDDKFTILERFGKVFDQSYTRFKDIKQAEAREKEAIKQSSLDRVRAEIASMRTTQDLERITPLIWSELLTLGVPFFRCGLMIVDEKEEKVRFYLSTPDGKPLAALNLHFESNDISSNGVKHWRKQEPYIAHWNQEEFLAFTKTLLDQQQIENPSTYQGGETPPESLTLQFIPFPQGMLYVGSAEDLTPAQIDLVKNLADTFSVAYARYEDFKQLEDAKSQIEHTLSELKSTQSQLIQSEKMASLGELTAGIAHEIQNPLNFVNNFSEVSKELLEEMMEEIANGDMEEVKAIADDIIQNLEKINHHGQRADGIVKGMLQHSRSSSGTKEPTDINALADEYLRLAYHGLRAKDKSFNASLETDFDDAIGNINVVPQDLGRVILNLITNAFYAVNEKKQKDNNFKPIVSVSTKKTGDHLEIKVTDNGGGIPQKVLDKIFQPFFTTKPAGQGTGLGLSMSYDIVTKGHGGVLKVETKEGEGTTFCINLPVTN